MAALFLALCLAGLGLVFGLPRRWIGAGLVLGWAGAVLAHLLLPAQSALPRALGFSARGWLALGLVAGLCLAYAWVLARLKARAGAGAAAQAATPAATTPPANPAFTPAELDRYARHIILRELGGPGQKRLKAARVLVIGAGGLGAPVLLYLGAAGVGHIAVIDDDQVANSNLQRQIIHTEAAIGEDKVASAARALQALNPHIQIRPMAQRLTGETAPGLFADYDLILDGSDNFETRYLVNATAVRLGKPLLAGAITQWEGQLSLYDPARGAPCYACIFPQAPAPGLAPSCAEAGVMAALPGVVGAIMASEAIKEITGAGLSLRGRLLLWDALWGENRVIAITPRPDCPICAAHRPS